MSIVQLRRWPLRKDVAATLPLAMEYRLESEGPYLLFERLRDLAALPAVVNGWYTSLGGVEVAIAFLSDTKAILKFGDQIVPICPGVTISHRVGFLRGLLLVPDGRNETIQFSYRIDDGWCVQRFIKALLRMIDSGEMLQANPLEYLTFYAKDVNGFSEWINALQPQSGAYKD